jgi:flagellar biosynthetic protein FliR
MHGELAIPAATLLGFLLTLVRVSGVFVFVPLPGMHTGVEMARIVMSVSITVALAPFWPHIATEPSMGVLVVWLASEAVLGVGIGLAVAFAAEGINMAAQIMGLQAGYAYASMIDPNSQADSSVLVVFAQLAAGIVFFTIGLDREVLRIFAASLTTMPAGSFALSRGAAMHLLEMAQVMFTTGVRLALPVIAVLVMVDISLALLGRVNAQLQMLSLAFPVKMMLALVIFGWTLGLLPTVLRSDLGVTLAAAKGLVHR